MSNPRDMRHVVLTILGAVMNLFGAQCLSASTVDFRERLNTLGFGLCELLEPGAQSNLLISPASVEFALGMAYAGASAETATAMSLALGLDGVSREEGLSQLAGLKSALGNPGKGVTLKLANAAWVDQSVHLNNSYSDELARKFQTVIRSISFNGPSTVSEINRWVSDATEGKIGRLLEKIPPPPLFLANAIYFHAQWKSPFDKKLTQQQPFYPAHAPSTSVSMMRTLGTFPYATGKDFAVVALPYRDERFVMYCFRPEKSLDLLIQELKKTAWTELTASLRPSEGSVALPKFKLEYGATLKEPLVKLGLGIAFDRDHADFSRITDDAHGLYISDVLHKAYLEINEEGSTAAAVTGIQMKTTAIISPKERFNLVFDHPFLLAIADTQTGVIIFLGMIANPKP
jgi:serine protease inhibitor